MKYLLLIYNNPASWAGLSEEERATVLREHAELQADLGESGELVGTQALADPVNTITVRVNGGIPATTDGPFAEANEHLVGYYLIECEEPERARVIATRIPDARYYAVEIRPIMEATGLEM